MDATLGSAQFWHRNEVSRPQHSQCSPTLCDALEREPVSRLEQPASPPSEQRGGRGAGECEPVGAARAEKVIDAAAAGRALPDIDGPLEAVCPGQIASRAAKTGCGLVWVRWLLGRPVIGAQRQHLGHVRDVVVQWMARSQRADVAGLIIDAGGATVLATADAVRIWQCEHVHLDARPLRHLRGRQPDAVHVAASVFRQHVLTGNGIVSRVADVALRRTSAGWIVWGVDTRSAVARFLGLPRRVVEWDVLAGRRFEPLPVSGTPTRTRYRLRT